MASQSPYKPAGGSSIHRLIHGNAGREIMEKENLGKGFRLQFFRFFYVEVNVLLPTRSIDKPALLKIRLLFRFVSDSEPSAVTS